MQPLAWILPALALLSPSLRADVRPTVIFGGDDREDVTEVRDSGLRRAARSVPAFFSRDQVSVSDGIARISSPSYGEKHGLCEGERFREQPAGAWFSGALIAPDRVLTAGHAMRNEEDCRSYLVVFGYDLAAPSPGAVPGTDVYACKRVLRREKSAKRGDYAIVELDRPVRDRAPLRLSRGGETAVGSRVAVLGYPGGLLLKVAAGAKVTGGEGDPAFFETDTDTFNGNSGSPILDLATGEIAGILVDGSESDFVDAPGGCRRHFRCEDAAKCGPEIATRASAIQVP